MNTQITLHERIDAPAVVSVVNIEGIRTFREAYQFGWENRKIKNMTQAMLAALTGMRPSHVSEYLDESEVDERGKPMRDMPAKYIPAFEQAVGNTFASQWLAMQSQLTILEAMIAAQE